MHDTRRHPSRGIGHAIVVGARIGAALGLLAAAAVSVLVFAVAGGSGDRAGPLDVPQLIDGIAAGAALGAVAVLVVRQRALTGSARSTVTSETRRR